MAYRFFLIAVLLLLAFVDPAFANWWIVRAADNKCLVVDIEPSGNDKDITKVGKDVYQTREQAEADVKEVCKEDPPPRTQETPSEVASRRLKPWLDGREIRIAPRNVRYGHSPPLARRSRLTRVADDGRTADMEPSSRDLTLAQIKSSLASLDHYCREDDGSLRRLRGSLRWRSRA